MPKMYHPTLPDQPIEVPDDAACVAAHQEMGWQLLPEPEQTHPGLVPEPVTYVAVNAEASKRRTAKDKTDS